jgi:hypothetical protein
VIRIIGWARGLISAYIVPPSGMRSNDLDRTSQMSILKERKSWNRIPLIIDEVGLCEITHDAVHSVAVATERGMFVIRNVT